MYALVPTDARCTTAGGPGTRFSAVAQRTGGVVDSICQSNYGPFLDNLLKRAGGPQADFPLTATPNGLTEMSVRVAGTTLGTDKWTYDTKSNTVVFKTGAVPVTGQTIEVRYRSVCAVP
jgi:hypothetical protein